MEENRAEQLLPIAHQGYFFVGGRYAATETGEVRTGQMYVEYQVPADVRSDWPVVLLSGAGQSGLNYSGTPDGREGWAQFFLRRGYPVYVADQPTRARSAHAETAGEMRSLTRESVERLFTAPGRACLWPQAARHTQWPGAGVAGDEVFDQYMSQSYPYLVDAALSQQMNRDAVVALLDRIGPAIILTHSQAGAYGWLVADARPQLVKAIVAMEPSGPPVREVAFVKAERADGVGREDGALTKPFGITALPLAYDPPLGEGEPLAFVKEREPAGPDLIAGWRQAEPARQLRNLRDVPVLVVTGEASYHAAYDHLTVAYLLQAGVPVTHIRLEDRDIRGNGHMMMLELNNVDVAAVAHDWLRATLRDGA